MVRLRLRRLIEQAEAVAAEHNARMQELHDDLAQALAEGGREVAQRLAPLTRRLVEAFEQMPEHVWEEISSEEISSGELRIED